MNNCIGKAMRKSPRWAMATLWADYLLVSSYHTPGRSR